MLDTDGALGLGPALASMSAGTPSLDEVGRNRQPSTQTKTKKSATKAATHFILLAHYTTPNECRPAIDTLFSALVLRCFAFFSAPGHRRKMPPSRKLSRRSVSNPTPVPYPEGAIGEASVVLVLSIEKDGSVGGRSSQGGRLAVRRSRARRRKVMAILPGHARRFADSREGSRARSLSCTAPHRTVQPPVSAALRRCRTSRDRHRREARGRRGSLPTERTPRRGRGECARRRTRRARLHPHSSQ